MHVVFIGAKYVKNYAFRCISLLASVDDFSATNSRIFIFLIREFVAEKIKANK